MEHRLEMSVIGCGYLGAVHAAAMASLGHSVVGVDVAVAKVEKLNRGIPSFYEPGLQELLEEQVNAGGLLFAATPAATQDCTIHFLCVGTPQQMGGDAADLQYLDAAVEGLLPHLKPGDIVVGKSTVPVGTAEVVARRVTAAQPRATVVWNPEFLREGRAIQDTLAPDRLVYGVDDGPAGARAVEMLNLVYAKALANGTPLIVTDCATAQLVKVAANSFLATKISFINAMAELCEATGADVTDLADAIGHDARIGRQFLNAGLGFGGGCLPKDIRAFMARADELGVDQALTFLREVDAINMRRRTRMVELAREACDGSLEARRIAILGAAFKPDSDDVRDSPALDVASQLCAQGADVVVTDPRAVPNAREKWPRMKFARTVDEAARGADLVLLLTEWPEYVHLDPEQLRRVVRQPRLVDGRSALDARKWRQSGWSYRALGRCA